MARTLGIIGLNADELAWVRLVVQLLRHPDPVVPELTRQALFYLQGSAQKSGIPSPLLRRSE